MQKKRKQNSEKGNETKEKEKKRKKCKETKRNEKNECLLVSFQEKYITPRRNNANEMHKNANRDEITQK